MIQELPGHRDPKATLVHRARAGHVDQTGIPDLLDLMDKREMSGDAVGQVNMEVLVPKE